MTHTSRRQHLTLQPALAALGLSLCAPGAFAQAERIAVDPGTEVPLALGWTDMDLRFDGSKYHILGQHNDIGTAHNTMTYTFVDPGFSSVLFEPGRFEGRKLGFPAIHARSVSTADGADYELTSVRLLLDPKTRSAYVVVAQREFGHTFVDSRPVTIELFRFRTLSDADRNAGEAPSAFVLERYFVTQKCYADSNYALVNELSLRPGPFDDRALSADRSSPCSKG